MNGPAFPDSISHILCTIEGHFVGPNGSSELRLPLAFRFADVAEAVLAFFTEGRGAIGSKERAPLPMDVLQASLRLDGSSIGSVNLDRVSTLEAGQTKELVAPVTRDVGQGVAWARSSVAARRCSPIDM